MKFLFLLVSIFIFILKQSDFSYATSIPVCFYTDSKGEDHLLKYNAETGGDTFIDYIDGNSGLCTKRAHCPKNIDLKVEECSYTKVSCQNVKEYVGDFPKCCLKC